MPLCSLFMLKAVLQAEEKKTNLFAFFMLSNGELEKLNCVVLWDVRFS